MTTKFKIGDKVRIVEKELPKTGIKYFDDVLKDDIYIRNVKEYFGKEAIIERYFEADDFLFCKNKRQPYSIYSRIFS